MRGSNVTNLNLTVVGHSKLTDEEKEVPGWDDQVGFMPKNHFKAVNFNVTE